MCNRVFRFNEKRKVMSVIEQEVRLAAAPTGKLTVAPGVTVAWWERNPEGSICITVNNFSSKPTTWSFYREGVQ